MTLQDTLAPSSRALVAAIVAVMRADVELVRRVGAQAHIAGTPPPLPPAPSIEWALLSMREVASSMPVVALPDGTRGVAIEVRAEAPAVQEDQRGGYDPELRLDGILARASEVLGGGSLVAAELAAPPAPPPAPPPGAPRIALRGGLHIARHPGALYLDERRQTLFKSFTIATALTPLP